jgi:hypothetical protein
MTDQSAQQSGSPKAPFDPIFLRLVKDGRGEKLLGFIAYGLYRDAKREWTSDFQAREERYPSEEELRIYEASWTTSRLEALENAAAQLVAAYTDSVVAQAEKQILRSALTGSYWRAVSQALVDCIEHPPLFSAALTSFSRLSMAWFIRKPRNRTYYRKRAYYCVGWTARDPQAGAFREVALPGISVMRVMDKAVHQAALECAGEKLVEFERRAGKDAL